MTKKPDWKREEFEMVVNNPAMSSEALAEQLPGRSTESVQLIREGLHAFHAGKNTSMLSEMMLARLEDSANEVTCPICGMIF